MPFGIIDTRYVDTPQGWDESYLAGYRTRSGLELTDLVREVDAAMARINNGANPLVSALASTTTEAATGRRRTDRKIVQRGGEYTVARNQYSSVVGHMLPIWPNELSLGFTEDGLHKISLQRFREELDDMVAAWDRIFLTEALQRQMTTTGVPVDDGVTTLSPGFAGSDGAFSGVYPNGAPIPGGYTHFAVTTAANLDTAIQTFVDRMSMWHPAPFDMIASESALALVKASTKFVGAGSNLIIVGSGTDQANVDAATYVGVWGDKVRVRHAVPELGSDEHISIFKTYGAFSPQNPLAIRFDPLAGSDVVTRSRETFPLAEAITLLDFGVGVRNRVGAANIYVDASAPSYVNPVIQF